MRRVLRIFGGFAAIMAITGAYWFMLFYYETRVATLEAKAAKPPEVTQDDAQRLETLSTAALDLLWKTRAEFDTALKNMARHESELHAEFLDRLEKQTELAETRAEATRVAELEQRELIRQYEERIKKLEDAIMFERVTKDLSFLVQIQVLEFPKIPDHLKKYGTLSTVQCGSGAIVDVDGRGTLYILTASHLSNHDPRDTQSYAWCHFMDGSPPQIIEFVCWSPKMDFAWMRFKNKDFRYHGKAVRLGDSDKLTYGSPVILLGFPFEGALGLNEMANLGYVSKQDFYYHPANRDLAKQVTQPKLIVHSAISNHGVSGGPLLDQNGLIVGIGTANINAGDKFSSPMGVALPINVVKKYLERAVKHGGEITHGHISGVTFKDTSEIAPHKLKEFRADYPEKNAVLVTSVASAKKGFLVGDLVLSANGRELQSVADLEEEVAFGAPNTTMTFTVLRAGKMTKLDILLSTYIMPKQNDDK